MSRKTKAKGREKAMLATVAAKMPARQPDAQTLDSPTAEQQAHATYVVQDVVDKMANGVTIRVSKAYRRQPLFETLWKQSGSGISIEGLHALRYYRARHEETEQSLTRCALDVKGRGAGTEAPLPRGVDPFMLVGEGADRSVELLEQAMGAVSATVRAVALDDRSYSDVAIERWGSRKQNWIKQPGAAGGPASHIEKIVPRSGRHREAIRQEFLLGLSRLVQAVQLLTARAAVPPPTSRPIVGIRLAAEPSGDLARAEGIPSVDPEFLNDQGHLREWSDIVEIILAKIDDQGEA